MLPATGSLITCYERSLGQRTHYQEEIDRQKVTLETLSQSAAALTSIEDLRNRIAGELELATPEDKRWVLRTLGVRGTVTNDGLGIELGVPSQLAVPDKRASIRNAQGLCSQMHCEFAFMVRVT